MREYEKWYYASMEELARWKAGTDEGYFVRLVDEHFTEYHNPLGPWLNRLRKAVFPNGGWWKEDNKRLYSRLTAILKAACEDTEVLA